MSRYLVMPSPAQLGTQHVTSGLVGYWDAGNSASYPGSGSTWTDLVGNSNGTLTNGPTFTAERGGGVVFDGTNDFVEIPHVSAFNVGGTVTVECVLYWDGVNTSRIVVGKRDTSSPFKQFGIWVSNATINGNGDHVGMYSFAGSGTPVRWARWQMPGAGIYHVIGRADLSSTTVTVNGVLQDTITSSSGGNYSTSRRLLIGQTDGLNIFYPGRVHLARIYNRVITAAEATQNFNAIRGRFGL